MRLDPDAGDPLLAGIQFPRVQVENERTLNSVDPLKPPAREAVGEEPKVPPSSNREALTQKGQGGNGKFPQ